MKALTFQHRKTCSLILISRVLYNEQQTDLDTVADDDGRGILANTHMVVTPGGHTDSNQQGGTRNRLSAAAVQLRDSIKHMVKSSAIV